MKRKLIGGPLDGDTVSLAHSVRTYEYTPHMITHCYHMRGNEDFVYIGYKRINQLNPKPKGK